MQHRASAPDLQRLSPETSRPGGGKGRKHRGSGGGGYRAVGAPLVGAALFAALLFYAARSFTHVSSYEHGSFGLPGGRGGGAGSRVQQQQQQQPGSGADGLAALLLAEGSGAGASQHPQRQSSWLSAAVLWAEEHQQQREQAKGSRYQHPSGCGLLPCAAQQAQRPATLVLYAYAAEDAEQQHNFAFFLKHAVEQQPWLTYRLAVAAGPGVLVGAGAAAAAASGAGAVWSWAWACIPATFARLECFRLPACYVTCTHHPLLPILPCLPACRRPPPCQSCPPTPATSTRRPAPLACGASWRVGACVACMHAQHPRWTAAWLAFHLHFCYVGSHVPPGNR